MAATITPQTATMPPKKRMVRRVSRAAKRVSRLSRSAFVASPARMARAASAWASACFASTRPARVPASEPAAAGSEAGTRAGRVEAKQAEAHAEAARAIRAGLATKADLDSLETRFAALETRLTIRFFGGMVAVCGVIVAAIELL